MVDEISFNYYAIEDFRFVWSNCKVIHDESDYIKDVEYRYFENLNFRLKIFIASRSRIVEINHITNNILLNKYNLKYDYELINIIELVTGIGCSSFKYNTSM
jgi:hypothetical protein